MKQGEPIDEGAPLIFVEEKDGVPHQTNIRTDRFDLAVQAMDALTKDSLAKAEGGTVKKGEEAPKEKGGDKSTKQGGKGGEAAPKDGGSKD